MTDDILDLERALWLEGPDRFRALMAEGCVMVFPPPAGILRAAAILDGIAGPRWVRVAMDDVVRADVENAAVLAYRAEANRAEGAPYRALCSSTWIRAAGGWRILAHQQTPVAP
jgi:hypothetical protein